MCWINWLNFSNTDIINKMNYALKHRWPDNIWFFSNNSVSLWHTRLSIIDLSENGNQPMEFDDGNLVITFNGEIYNYLELKKDLIKKWYKFSTDTDTEVIIISYKEYWQKCVEKFNWMWAFCIYDKKNDYFFLSRDRFGIKPLYYYFDWDNFIFSSEIKWIIKSWLYNPKVNERVLFDYLNFTLVDNTEDTFFKNIYKLEKATNLIFKLSSKELKYNKYWEININNKEKNDFYNLFKKSLKYRLISDVPIWLSLSWWLDSSSIVSSVDKYFYNKKIKTFSVIFPWEDIDESSYIKEVTDNTNFKNIYTTVSWLDLKDNYKNFIYFQEEPVRSTSMFAHYNILQKVKENNIVVLLEWQWADELLAWYYPNPNIYLLCWLLKKLKFKSFLKEYKINKKLYNISLINIFINFVPKKIKNFFHLLIFKNTLINKKFLKENIKKSSYFKTKNITDIKTHLLYKFSNWLTALLRYGDKNSMWNSIEVRYPFLDYKLVENVFYSFKDEDYICNWVNKYKLRESLKWIIPDEIYSRKNKIWFETPEMKWFYDKKFISFYKSIINSETFKRRKYWNYFKVLELLEKSNKSKIEIHNLWKILNTELWLRVFIDKK